MARRAPDNEFRAWIEAARAVPIEDLAHLRGWKLRGANERVGACPDCGGEDRFGINLRKQIFRCRQSGQKGGVIDLVMYVDHCDVIRACETLTGRPSPKGDGNGLTPEELAKLEADRLAREAEREAVSDRFREAERAKAHKHWMRALPAPGSLVEDYLRLRGLSLPATAPRDPAPLIRFRPDAHFYVLRPNAPAEQIHAGPCMYAAIVGPDGRFSGLHQTWLDLSKPDGKAEIVDPKTGEVLPAKKVRGSKSGGRLELARVEEPRRLVIAEGIETTLSLREGLLYAGEDLARTAFWAGIDLGNIGGPAEGTVPHPTLKHRNGHRQTVPSPVPTRHGGIPIPDSVREIVIGRDADSDPFLVDTTLARAARRWSRPGRVIRAASPPAGTDFNDFLRNLS